MDQDDESEIVKLTTAALDLAVTAVHFDNTLHLVGACDYYDKTILHLDEVMNKLPRSSEEWQQLMQLRTKYDDRLETLREIEKSRHDISMLSLGGDGNSGSRKGLKPKQRRQSHVAFEEDLLPLLLCLAGTCLLRPIWTSVLIGSCD